MAAIDFPSNPTNGQQVTVGGTVFEYNSTKGYWLGKHGGIKTSIQTTVSDTAPSSPSNGDLWFNSANLKTYIYYDDGSSAQWVVSVGAGVDGVAGADGSSVTVYANFAAFPSSGNTVGDFAFAQDNKALYVWDGTEWDRIYSGVQESVEWTTEPPDNHELNKDGSTSTITGVAVDPDSFPITYSYDTNPANPAQVASIVNNNDGSFTLTPSTDTADTGNFIFRSKANDGISTIKKSTTVSLAFNFSSPSQVYATGAADGLIDFKHADIAGGNEFQVRYASYGGKGWFEMAFFANENPYAPSGSYLDWPWRTDLDTHFLVTGSNRGWNGSIDYGSEYGLRNRNAQGSLGGTNNTSNGLDYAKDLGVLLFGNAFTCDGVLITAKSSKTADGVAPNSNVTQQDAEGNTIYPLNTPSHMPNATLRTAFHNYFMGLAPAVNWEDSAHNDTQSFDHWKITSGSTFTPFVSMNNRGGSVNNSEWHIATGYNGPSGPSTYRPNIGYRNSTSYGYSNVGTWKIQPGTSEDLPWASDHVLSIWVSGS